MLEKHSIDTIAIRKFPNRSLIIRYNYFLQRVLLTLEEEGIVYDREFIDLDNKPEWFKDVNPAGSGTVLAILLLSVAVIINDTDLCTCALHRKNSSADEIGRR